MVEQRKGEFVRYVGVEPWPETNRGLSEFVLPEVGLVEALGLRGGCDRDGLQGSVVFGDSLQEEDQKENGQEQ